MWYCGPYSFSWLWCIIPVLFFVFCFIMMFLCVKACMTGLHNGWMPCGGGRTKDRPNHPYTDETGRTSTQER